MHTRTENLERVHGLVIQFKEKQQVIGTFFPDISQYNGQGPGTVDCRDGLKVPKGEDVVTTTPGPTQAPPKGEKGEQVRSAVYIKLLKLPYLNLHPLEIFTHLMFWVATTHNPQHFQ